MTTKRTTPPDWYMQPTEGEVKRKASEIGLNVFSPDLTIALANIAAGGEVIPIAERESRLQKEALRAVKATAAGTWLSPSGSRYSDRKDAVKAGYKFLRDRESNIATLLQSVEMEAVPGESPLEKACNFLKIISASNRRRVNDDNDDDDEDRVMCPIEEDEFYQLDENAIAKMAKIASEAKQLYAEMSDLEKDLLLDWKGLAAEGEELDETEAMCKLADDTIRVMIKLARNLDKLSKFRVYKAKKFEADTHGEHTRNRAIKTLGEVGRLVTNEWTLPKTMRNYRLASNQAVVRERGHNIEKKQLLFQITDCSGSMDQGNRVALAMGVLLNRIQAVIKGDCEMFHAFFDTGLKKLCRIEKDGAKTFLQEQARRSNFNGGGTSIQGCILQAAEYMEKELASDPTLERPEIVVVTDGLDSVNPEKVPRGFKVHAFICEDEGENMGLRKLVERTGGIYTRVNI